MSKEELKELLRENLVVNLYESEAYTTSYLNVEVRFDGDVICKDSMIIEYAYE